MRQNGKDTMSETPSNGISKKLMALISTGVVIITYLFCESGIINVPAN